MNWRGARIPTPSSRSIVTLFPTVIPTSSGGITKNWARTNSHARRQSGLFRLELVVGRRGSNGRSSCSPCLELLENRFHSASLDMPGSEDDWFRRARILFAGTRSEEHTSELQSRLH